ncbi:MAG: acetyl-CoA hydrolase/transferase family protein [Dehalococcoidia bacterium]
MAMSDAVARDDWRKHYRSRTVSADEAMTNVHSGERVVFSLAGPVSLPSALMRRSEALQGVELRLSSPPIDPGWYALETMPSFTIEFEVFIGDLARPAHDQRRGSYLPNLLSTGFKPLDEGRAEAKPIDVACISVGPPNEAGYCCVGPQLWNKRLYARRARLTIAEVVPDQIRCFGDCFLHVSEIDYFVPLSLPSLEQRLQSIIERLPEGRRREVEGIVAAVGLAAFAPYAVGLASGELDGVRALLGLGPVPEPARTIANYVGELVPHGATIQIGVGEPARFLVKSGVFDNKLDLGLHTEMMCPGLATLARDGVITGRRKTLHRGKAVAVAWAGSNSSDMAYIADNPTFELYDPDYLLHVPLLAANDNYYSMNNAIGVDLTGQITSESVYGGRMINGTGGQPELHLGAFLSRGGRAITLLPSTAARGSVSRIVAEFERGTLVTVPRFYADTVVTEYGVARLLGKNHRERAQELISVAHPDFRPELRRQAHRLFEP